MATRFEVSIDCDAIAIRRIATESTECYRDVFKQGSSGVMIAPSFSRHIYVSFLDEVKPRYQVKLSATENGDRDGRNWDLPYQGISAL